MPPLPSLTRRPAEVSLAGPISAFESETQAVLQRTTPYSEHAVLHVLAGIVVLSIFLMSIVKIDRVVTSTGRIVTTEGSLFVQPLDRSIIKDIDVTTGDVVKKGQVLARLDPTFATADLTQLTQKMESAQALVDRLTAERAGQPYAPTSNTPAALLQLSLYHQRQAEYQQNLADLDAQIDRAKSTLAGAKRDTELYSERLEHAGTIETMRKTLEGQGYGSKLNSVLATDSRAEVSRLLADSQSLDQQSRHALESLTAQRGVFVEKWQDDVATNLVTAQNDLDQTARDLAKAQKNHELITLVAPEDAIVLKIAQASTGSVVTEVSTEPLFTLVPLGGAVEAEVEIDSKDVGFIKVGDHVEIKLDAYPFMRHGTIKGTIKTISEGSFTTAGDNQQQVRSPYFKARVTIDGTQLRNVPDSFRLIPGMTLSGDVLVGHRTIMSYLIEGGLRTGSEAMREP
jgi:HlyD family type I secretion membrane fusion protein